MRPRSCPPSVGHDRREAIDRFETLVHPHLADLLGFAERRLRSEADAKDVVQDALVRAWSSFESLRDGSSVRAWLYQVLRNAIADRERTSGRRQALVSITTLDGKHEASLADDVSPLEIAIERASTERVRRALGSLPVEFAVAVELHDIDGLLYREIAAALEIPLGTVMSRISRGRRLLVALLAHDEGRCDGPITGSRGRATLVHVQAIQVEPPQRKGQGRR